MFQGPRILDIVPPEAAARCSRSAERGPLDIVGRSPLHVVCPAERGTRYSTPAGARYSMLAVAEPLDVVPPPQAAATLCHVDLDVVY